MTGANQTWLDIQRFFQRVSLIAMIGLSAVLIGATVAAALGLAPWISFTASYGETSVPYAGMVAQLLLAVLALSLCFYLPSNRRIMNLEASHRSFHMSMEDVTRAYVVAHNADKHDQFSLSSEFDSVRERIMHLRDHPDLHALEPSVLEVAAQMSHESRDLAKIYSEEKVERARTFLRQRQQEIEEYRAQISLAQKTCAELKRWTQQVNVEDSVVDGQMQQLKTDLAEILPLIGYELNESSDPENVVALPKPKTTEQTTG